MIWTIVKTFAQTHKPMSVTLKISTPSGATSAATGGRLSMRPPPYEPEVQAAVANSSFKSGLAPRNLRLALVHAPKQFIAFQAMAHSLLFEGKLPEREREIAIIRTGALSRSEYEWGMHVSIYAARCGLTDEQVDDLTAGTADARRWTHKELAIIQAVDELHLHSTISNGTWEALRAHWPEDQIVEMMLSIGFYRMAAMFLNSMAVPLEEGARQFPMTFERAHVTVDKGVQHGR